MLLPNCTKNEIWQYIVHLLALVLVLIIISSQMSSHPIGKYVGPLFGYQDKITWEFANTYAPPRIPPLKARRAAQGLEHYTNPELHSHAAFREPDHQYGMDKQYKNDF
jgi:hypothetical protein